MSFSFEKLNPEDNERIKALLDGSRGRAKTGFKLEAIKGSRGTTGR